MNEIWKEVPGYFGYEISSLGRLRTAKDGPGIVRGHIHKGGVTLSGYRQYQLGRGRGFRISAHSLVLLAFVGPRPSPEIEINHKNGEKLDNRLENLEYCTRSENCLHMTNVLGKRRGESHGNAKITEDDVREIRRLGATTTLTHAEIGARFGITNKNVGYILRRQAWGHVV